MQVAKDHLSKGHQLAEYQPEVNHLWIRCKRQLLHHADEDGSHDEHGGQVHTQGRLKEERLEEGGGKGDHEEQEGRQKGRQHLTHDLSLQDNGHRYPLLWYILVHIIQVPRVHNEKDHIFTLFHPKLVRVNPHGEFVQVSSFHVN